MYPYICAWKRGIRYRPARGLKLFMEEAFLLTKNWIEELSEEDGAMVVAMAIVLVM